MRMKAIENREQREKLERLSAVIGRANPNGYLIIHGVSDTDENREFMLQSFRAIFGYDLDYAFEPRDDEYFDFYIVDKEQK